MNTEPCHLEVLPQVTLRPMDELQEAPWNPQDHTPEHVERLKASMLRFGFVVPLVVRLDGVVVGGHGRLRAARGLYEEGYGFSGPDGDCLPCMVGEWDDDQTRWLNLALNHIQQDLDRDRVQTILRRLQATWTVGDLTVMGYTSKQVEALLRERKPIIPKRDTERVTHKPQTRKITLMVAPKTYATLVGVLDGFGSDDDFMTTALDGAEREPNHE